jgi:hypothetical protein
LGDIVVLDTRPFDDIRVHDLSESQFHDVDLAYRKSMVHPGASCEL